MSLCPNCSNQLLDDHPICLSCGLLIDNSPNLNIDSLVSVAPNEPFSETLCEAPANEDGVPLQSVSKSSLRENEAEP